MLAKKIKSVFTNTCPRCHKGQFYKSGNPWNIKLLGKFNPSCDNCGLKYELENSFFYGAMYVSYALNVAWMVMAWVIMELFFADYFSLEWIVAIITGFMLLMVPLTFYASKLIWINLFVKFDSTKVT